MAIEVLPNVVPMSRVSAGRPQAWATRDACGERLTSWDSQAGALCDDDTIIDSPITPTQRCLMVLTGPVASSFSFSVFRFSNDGVGSLPTPPPITFTLYLGQRQGAVKLITALWTPATFEEHTQLICRVSGVSFSAVYVFGAIEPGAGQTERCKSGFGFLAQEVSSQVYDRFAGPNVLVTGPY